MNAQGRTAKRRFLADAMLGSLAKWLRALGYDTHYQPCYREETIRALLVQGRMLLSRNRRAVHGHDGSLLIHSERLDGQIRQLRSAGLIHTGQEGWFTRCLLCNVPLEKAAGPEPGEVPEHVLHENPDQISRCPSCGRYFWPGTHRERMLRQLREWGLSSPDSLKD